MIKTGRVKYKFVPKGKIVMKDWRKILSYDVNVNNPKEMLETTEGFIWHKTEDLQLIFNDVYNRYKNSPGFSVRWLSMDGNDSTTTASYLSPARTIDRIKQIVGSNPTIVLVKNTSPSRYEQVYNISSNTTISWNNIVFFGGRFNSNLQCTSVEKPVLKFSGGSFINLYFLEIHNIKVIWPYAGMNIVSGSSAAQYFNTLFFTPIPFYGYTDYLDTDRYRWTLFRGQFNFDEAYIWNDYIFSNDRKGYMFPTWGLRYAADVKDFNDNLIWSKTSGNYFELRDELLNNVLAGFRGSDIFNTHLLTDDDWRIVNGEVSNSIVLRRIGLIEDFVNEYRINVRRYYDNDKIIFLNGYWLVDRDEDYSELLNKKLNQITFDDLYDISENLVLLLEDDNGNKDIALLYNQNVYNTVWSKNDVIGSPSSWTIKKVFQIWMLQENVEATKYSDSSYEMILVFRNFDNEIIDKAKMLLY